MQREIDKVAVNEGLIRTALTVLQDSMTNLSTVTNKLNLDMITQKHKLNSLATKVSHEYIQQALGWKLAKADTS